MTRDVLDPPEDLVSFKNRAYYVKRQCQAKLPHFAQSGARITEPLRSMIHDAVNRGRALYIPETEISRLLGVSTGVMVLIAGKRNTPSKCKRGRFVVLTQRRKPDVDPNRLTTSENSEVPQ